MNIFTHTYSKLQAEEEQRHGSSEASKLTSEVGPTSQFTPAWRAFVDSLVKGGAIRHITRDGERYVSAQELDAFIPPGSEEPCWARTVVV